MSRVTSHPKVLTIEWDWLKGDLNTRMSVLIQFLLEDLGYKEVLDGSRNGEEGLVGVLRFEWRGDR